MQEPLPVPLRRYLVAGLLGAAAVGGLLLVTRPILFSFAPPLDDSNHAVAAAAAVKTRPVVVELVLNESHGIAGEVHRGGRVGLTVVVSAVGPEAFAVVDAWSPTHACAITLAGDRLLDCAGDAWTFDGIPLDPADPPLQAFPVSVRNGAVVADFTRK